MSQSISNRGLKASETIMRVDLKISFDALSNQYHPIDNPAGVFPLSVAENKLSWPELKTKFKSIASQHDIDDWVLGYTSPLGSEEFRQAIASFYEQFLTQCPIDPASLACAPGATGIIEMCAFLLADEGDVAAFPAPAYPVYRQDIKNISGIERYDILTHTSLEELQGGSPLQISHLAKAKADIESTGKTLKLLILTSPDNPTGLVYDDTKLEEIAEWCISHQIHMVVNEIYRLSTIDITRQEIKDDYEEGLQEPSSFAQLMMKKRSEYLHHWYSFSKDFGISGFRVGIVHSHNEAFIIGFENYNLSHSVSNHTQWLLMHMILDSSFLESYIHSNKQRLTQSYIAVVQTLRKHNIPYVPSRGALFVWADFSKYLIENTEDAEMKFWMKLFESTGLLFTPGNGFGHIGHGKFRIVYPYISYEYLLIAMSRLDSFLINTQ